VLCRRDTRSLVLGDSVLHSYHGKHGPKIVILVASIRIRLLREKVRIASHRKLTSCSDAHSPLTPSVYRRRSLFWFSICFVDTPVLQGFGPSTVFLVAIWMLCRYPRLLKLELGSRLFRICSLLDLGRIRIHSGLNRKDSRYLA
jgi:hypothetical protein